MGFDQSERAQGPIYILIIYNQCFYNLALSLQVHVLV